MTYRKVNRLERTSLFSEWLAVQCQSVNGHRVGLQNSPKSLRQVVDWFFGSQTFSIVDTSNCVNEQSTSQIGCESEEGLEVGGETRRLQANPIFGSAQVGCRGTDFGFRYVRHPDGTLDEID